jgi:regulatory protein
MIARGDRFFLEISTLEERLEVTAELANQYRLKAGIVITEPQLEQLVREAELHLCRRELSRLLAMRSHSVQDATEKLRRRKFSSDAIASSVGFYREKGILDDEQYAWQEGERLLSRNPAGRAYLTAHLQRKGIERSLAEQTAGMLFQDVDETSLAREALERRWPVYRQFGLERARTKAYTYLSRRGLGYEAAKAAVEELLNTENEVTED